MIGSRRALEGAKERPYGAPGILCAALLFLLFSLLLAGPSALSQGGKGVPVRLIVQWVPQAQFAGYYVAQEKGLYRKRGLDVTILRGGPQRNPSDLLQRGEADVGTFFLTGALTACDKGLPLVHLTQVVNQSNLMLVGWKKKGITRVEDLDGRRVSMWDDQFNSPFLSLFRRRGIKPVLVPQYFTVNLFLAGGVDACAAMHYNEYHRIYEAGVDPEEVTPLFMEDLGFGIPEDGLYCLESFYRKDTAACKAFAEASLEGWRRAAEDPDEAVEVVMRAARGSHVPANAAHTRWMLKTILRTIIPRQGDAWKLGELSMEDYRRAADMLEEQGLIKRAPSYWTFRGEVPGRAE